MKKTKIICTMGPNTDKFSVMEGLAKNGMDIARFNFSHGDHEEHRKRLELLKIVRSGLGLPIAALLDTKGPEIRTGVLKDEKKVMLEDGQTYVLTTREIVGDDKIGYINYAGLPEDVKPGNRILIDDGLIELEVEAVENGTDIVCRVLNGGELGMRKGVNVPNVKIKLPALTEKDKEDIRFGIAQGFDFIAASFVRTADAIYEIKKILEEEGARMGVIAKIENAEGIENLDAIIEASDGIMVARGDMGVEIPPEQVPFIQKTIIRKCNEACKPVITATQMLDSMIRNPRPTRAEVSDVANAVFDGTSCVMLSGETASGKYPIEALQTMVDIVVAAEEDIDYWKRFRNATYDHTSTITDAISHTSCLTAMDLSATAILAATRSGYTARMISRFRPGCVIAALTTEERVRRQLAISWGVAPYLVGNVDSTDRLFSLSVDAARKEGLVEKGDTVVITAGVPIGRSGSTNLIKAQVVK